MTPKSPAQRALDANETNADLAHRCHVLRGQRDYARRLAVMLALALAMALLASYAGAFNSTEVVSITGRDLAAHDGRVC